MAAGIALYEASFSALATASSKGAINPEAGAAGAALNAGVGSLWVAYTYGRSRQ